MNKDLLSLEDLASKTSVAAERISDWIKAELLRPDGFTDGKAPLFAAGVEHRVARLQKLADLGYGTEEILKIIKKVGHPQDGKGRKKEPAKGRFLTVGNLAERSGVSPRTIKHWEDKGIIGPFGLAKLAAEPHVAPEAPTAAGEWVTGAGVALGTVGYMSPEQVRGEVLDARTDLFSLGVVLYELATGTAPFGGATSGAVLGEILTKAPAAPVRLNPEVPPELERIVNKLLEKARALRYQSARDLRVDLERLRLSLTAPAAARTEQPSIVVLPFENLSPDPDNAFFADGLTEEIIADLSKIQGLRVISRTSAMMFKGVRKSAPAIAQELNVRHVLERLFLTFSAVVESKTAPTRSVSSAMSPAIPPACAVSWPMSGGWRRASPSGRRAWRP